jgi:hypothetical protein
MVRSRRALLPRRVWAAAAVVQPARRWALGAQP